MTAQISPPRTEFSRILPTLLLLLTVFGPISMDLYLPALPALAAELGAATSVAQLTVTACLIGLALGQLIAGPLSDRFGRRGILLLGIVAYIVTSALCAISPTVELLITARFVQGLAGGVGIVIAQAAGRDIYTGGALVRFYGRLTVVGGLAAIIGPLLGGVLNTVVDWRGLFVFLALIGAGILVIALRMFPETLPAESRATGGLTHTLRDFRTLLSDRVFVGAILNQGFLYGALFAYLAGSTFVLQDIYGLSPLAYALAFGLNSAGFMTLGYLAGRAAERWSITGTLTIGILVAGIGSLGLLSSGLTRMPLWVVIVSLFLLAGGVAISSPPATTLALVDYPQMAGTASSLLGMVRFGFGGIAAPLVGVAGALSILPLGVVTTVAVVLAGAAFLLLARRPQPRASAAPLTDDEHAGTAKGRSR
jgi:DHA1 family bicyclomycin/chloramphenicol resistance-like MFS transporter